MRRADKQAGLAYVEVLIAVPVLIVLFAGALAVGRAFDARVVAGQRARQDAWTDAMAGCPHGLALSTRAPGDVTPALLARPELKRGTARGEAMAQPFETTTQFACNEQVVPQGANDFVRTLLGGR